MARRTYTTNFSLTENPISESGNWVNGGVTGLDWHNVRTTSHLAFGTMIEGGGFRDSTAILGGTFGADQTVTATVFSQNQTTSAFEEVEIRLRSNITAHSNTGYEITFRATTGASSYVQIVRWNGALGDFTYIDTGGHNYNGIQTGDVVSATIIGNQINAYVNGTLVNSATDSTSPDRQSWHGFLQHWNPCSKC